MSGELAVDSATEARRTLRTSVLAITTLLIAGAVSTIVASPAALQEISIFYEQFAKIEPLPLALIAAFAIAARILSRGSPGASTERSTGIRLPRIPLAAGIILIALGVFLVAIIGTSVVIHHFFLADDEYSAWFQAVIFAHGRWSATVAPEWCRWITSLTPDSVGVPSACTWHLSFLPIHSLIRAAFIALHIDPLAGPTIGAVSIALVVAIARKAWPDRPDRAWLAAGALATSTTFLFNSMTMWSMPTHLLVDLVWIWLYIENELWSIALLPVVGFISFGVHSPTPHALLVIAFFLRYLRQRRWGVLLYLVPTYALSGLFWMKQLGGAASAAAPALATVSATAGAARSIFAMPSSLQAFTTAMHLALVLTWNSPIVPIAVLAAMLSWKRLDTFGRDLALSLLIVLAARAVNPGGAGSQGEGWGYRYMYNALGNFALLAACGADVLIDAMGRSRATLLAAASLAATVFIQLPMRAIQVREIIAPYYRTSVWLASQPQQILVVPLERAFWARQLVRNDPFLLDGNKIMDGDQLKDSDVVELERRYPGQVRVVTQHELTALGLEPVPIRVGGIRIIPH